MPRNERSVSAEPMLTGNEASALARKNIENIVRKVASGKTLTARESALLEAFQAGEGRPQQPYYDSIANAASSLGVSAPLLRLAKKSGAPGFLGSRVYPEKLLPWLVKWLWDSSKLKDAENFKTLIDHEKHRRE